MIRTTKVEIDVQPTVREIADCIWDMSARDQVRLLSELNRVCFSDANAGDVQMHRMSEEINNADRLPKIVRVSAKRFLDKMKDYLM